MARVDRKGRRLAPRQAAEGRGEAALARFRNARGGDHAARLATRLPTRRRARLIVSTSDDAAFERNALAVDIEARREMSTAVARIVVITRAVGRGLSTAHALDVAAPSATAISMNASACDRRAGLGGFRRWLASILIRHDSSISIVGARWTGGAIAPRSMTRIVIIELAEREPVALMRVDDAHPGCGTSA